MIKIYYVVYLNINYELLFGFRGILYEVRLDYPPWLVKLRHL